MTKSLNLARDMAIVRRYREGEKAQLLAAVFRLNVTRIYELNRSFGDLPAKPRIKVFSGGLWACISQDAESMGDTPASAYAAWVELLSAFLRRVTRAPQKIPDPVPLPAATVAPLTIGRSARMRPLTMSATMQINAARAMEAQPRMASLAGVNRNTGAKFNV